MEMRAEMSDWVKQLSYVNVIFTDAMLFICLISSACAKDGQVQTKADTASSGSEQCVDALPDRIMIDAGLASIGSDSFYPEERPVRFIEVGAFDIDTTEVTNADFQTCLWYNTNASMVAYYF